MAKGEAASEHIVAYTGSTFEGLVVCDRDVTGVTGTIQVTKPGAIVLTGDLEVVDGPSGQVAWKFSAEEMSGVAAGRYQYVAALSWPDNTIKVVLTGQLEVRQGLVS